MGCESCWPAATTLRGNCDPCARCPDTLNNAQTIPARPWRAISAAAAAAPLRTTLLSPYLSATEHSTLTNLSAYSTTRGSYKEKKEEKRRRICRTVSVPSTPSCCTSLLWQPLAGTSPAETLASAVVDNRTYEYYVRVEVVVAVEIGWA